MMRILRICILFLFGLLSCVWVLVAISTQAAASFPLMGEKILVFSRTEGFRHPSIPDGQKMIQGIGLDNGWKVDLTENPLGFTEANLDQYAVVIWLNTTGDVLDTAQEEAFENYINNGGGYVGIHSAADTEYAWPFYGMLMGAYFKNHPAVQGAIIDVEDTSHPSVSHLGPQWIRTDEWYNFQLNPRPDVNVVASLIETSYSGGTMGDHPIAWYHNVGSGRAFYTGCGHTVSSYTSEPDFRRHIEGAIMWTGKLNPATPSANLIGSTILLVIVGILFLLNTLNPKESILIHISLSRSKSVAPNLEKQSFTR